MSWVSFMNPSSLPPGWDFFTQSLLASIIRMGQKHLACFSLMSVVRSARMSCLGSGFSIPFYLNAVYCWWNAVNGPGLSVKVWQTLHAQMTRIPSSLVPQQRVIQQNCPSRSFEPCLSTLPIDLLLGGNIVHVELVNSDVKIQELNCVDAPLWEVIMVDIIWCGPCVEPAW